MKMRGIPSIGLALTLVLGLGGTAMAGRAMGNGGGNGGGNRNGSGAGLFIESEFQIKGQIKGDMEKLATFNPQDIAGKVRTGACNGTCAGLPALSQGAVWCDLVIDYKASLETPPADTGTGDTGETDTTETTGTTETTLETLETIEPTEPAVGTGLMTLTAVRGILEETFEATIPWGLTDEEAIQYITDTFGPMVGAAFGIEVNSFKVFSYSFDPATAVTHATFMVIHGNAPVMVMPAADSTLTLPTATPGNSGRTK